MTSKEDDDFLAEWKFRTEHPGQLPKSREFIDKCKEYFESIIAYLEAEPEAPSDK
jgi:hypothetical protein